MGILEVYAYVFSIYDARFRIVAYSISKFVVTRLVPLRALHPMIEIPRVSVIRRIEKTFVDVQRSYAEPTPTKSLLA